jgi:hypothetical protein
MAITDGIVGCWSPSLGASGYRLLDRSGRGNHGTLNNMDAGTDWVGTPVGLALDYDGTNDYVVVPRKREYDSTRWRTLSAWINARSFDGQFGFNDILACDTIGGTREWAFGTQTDAVLTDAKLFCAIFGTGGGEISVNSPETLQVNQWYHIAWSHDGSYTTGGYAVYYNGVPQTLTNTSSGTFTAPGVGTADLGIGRRTGNGGFDLHFNGQIGECAIYNRPLAAAEIRELYRRGNGAIGRELTGQTRRRSYGFVGAGFRPYWASRRTQVIGGGVR